MLHIQLSRKAKSCFHFSLTERLDHSAESLALIHHLGCVIREDEHPGFVVLQRVFEKQRLLPITLVNVNLS